MAQSDDLKAARQFRRAIEFFIQTLDEEKSLEVAELYPEWQPGKAYKPNEIIRYGKNADGDSQLFQVMQGHGSQPDWLPEKNPALYKKIGFTEEGVAVWTQPQGGHDAYQIGDVVEHNGQQWESTAANNVWEPGVYGWTVKQ